MTQVNGIGSGSNHSYLTEESARRAPRPPESASESSASSSVAQHAVAQRAVSPRPTPGPVRRDSLTADEANDYVNRAAENVRNAYQAQQAEAKNYKGPLNPKQYNALATPPAVAATEKLLEATDTRDRPYVTPELTARIFERLRTDQQDKTPSTMDRIIADLALKGDGYRALLDKDNSRSFGPAERPTYDKVIRNLSVAMDSMGRAQKGGKYLSPLIEQEVRHIGRQLAEHIGFLRNPPDPFGGVQGHYTSRFDAGFKQAAAEGSGILALETARQLVQPEAPFGKRPYGNWDPRAQAGAILDAVREGTGQYDEATQRFFGVVHQNLAPVLGPLSEQGENLSEAQQRAGVENIFKTVKNGDKLLARIQNDRREIDTRGYQLMRFGETIGHYQHSLGDLSEYRELSKSRGDLLNSMAGKTLSLLSQSALHEIYGKIGLRPPEGRYAQGLLGPTLLPYASQGPDGWEYLMETYNLGKRQPADTPPKLRKDGRYEVPARRIPIYDMPADVAGLERTYNSGEFREAAKGDSILSSGRYAIDKTAVGMQTGQYEATRLGRRPMLGLGVWATGGIAQAALTEYIVNEVGFDEGQEFRKVLLVGLVGGFAGFHLTEAVMAGARLVSDNQPWTRFSVTGTTGVTGSLAALMSIATAWDLSGVYYNAKGESDPSQGMWGSPLWKVGTHGANLASDALLLRLQVREFAKRVWPTLADKYGTESLPARAAARLSTSRTLSAIATRFALSDNPIGLIVNVGYAGTTVWNYVVDRNRYIKNLETYDKAFLQGAGVGEMQADILKTRDWVTAQSRGHGFAVGYAGVDGPVGKYVDYINGQTNREDFDELVNAARALPRHLEKSPQPGEPDRLKQSDPNAAYYALPKSDPSQLDLSRFPNVYRDGEYFRDSVTRLYYDSEWHAWRSEVHRGKLGWYYFPDRQVSEEYGLKGNARADMAPTGVEGWKAILIARGQMP